MKLKNLENGVSPIAMPTVASQLCSRGGGAYQRNRQDQDDNVKDEIGDGAAPDDRKCPCAVFGLGAVPQGREVVAALDAEEDGVSGGPERAEDDNGHDDDAQHGLALLGTENAMVEK